MEILPQAPTHRIIVVAQTEGFININCINIVSGDAPTEREHDQRKNG